MTWDPANYFSNMVSTHHYGLSEVLLSFLICGRGVELSLRVSPEPRASRSCQPPGRGDRTAANSWNSPDPAERQAFTSPGRFLPELPGHPGAEGRRQPVLAGENCTVMFTDVVGFGAPYRTDRDRRIIRQASLAMIKTALGALWEACIAEDRGDGLLIVAPPSIPTARLMERLHRELPGELRLHNRTYGESARIRLRLAVNVGPVTSDPPGMSGEAIIRTARLVDAPVLKERMTSTGASLGIIVSDFVYETVIRHAEGWINPDEYGAAWVNVKESAILARIWMLPTTSLPPAAPRIRDALTPQPYFYNNRP